MRMHVTRTNNLGGTQGFAQKYMAEILCQLGCMEMGFFGYPSDIDTDNDLNHRMDGIIASLWYDDVVFFQYPSWNGTRFDRNFVDHIKGYPDAKLIIFVHDIRSFQNVGWEQYLQGEIDVLNKANLLILPSKRMHEKLIEKGLNVQKVIYQEIFDRLADSSRWTRHQNIKRMIFAGNTDHFADANNYHGTTPIEIYSDANPLTNSDVNCVYQGFRDPGVMPDVLAEGGFGLVWSDLEFFERYYSLNHPFKLNSCLTAGIPVIVRKGSADDEFVNKYGVGFTVESLEEADQLIQNLSDDEYNRIYRNVRNVQYLLDFGTFSKKMFMEAFEEVMR